MLTVVQDPTSMETKHCSNSSNHWFVLLVVFLILVFILTEETRKLAYIIIQMVEVSLSKLTTFNSLQQSKEV
jgi:hypothetical protein